MHNQILVAPARPRGPRDLRHVVPSRRPERAPALEIVGHCAAAPGARISFRLPCPPDVSGPLGTSAAERRVRKAYFATLDALRTGVADPDRIAALARLARDVRCARARVGLLHLLRAQRFVRATASGWPVIPAPSGPLGRIVVTVPAGIEVECPDALATRFAWTLDWLRMHRWIDGSRATVAWRATSDSLADAILAAA